MTLAVEALKVAGTILGIWLGGYLAVERLVEESRVNSERATQIELVKRFVTDTGDLNDVFRSMTMLVRAGFLSDPQGHLRREIELYFGQKMEEVILGTITTAHNTSSPQPAQRSALPPGSDRSSSAAAEGDPAADWLRQVGLLAGSDATIRRATAQRLVDAIRNDRPPSTVSPLIRALVEQLSEAQIRGLSATGRFNTLVVLGAVTADQWRQLPEPAASLRMNLDSLERRATAGQVTIGQDTAREIAKLRTALAG